jgi:TonB-dependent starch-binding outer membrane protein SusC
MKRIRSSAFSLLLLVLVSASAFAQTRRVSGRVTVEGSGEPIVAASVNLVGTSVGTYTDEQGRFTVVVPDGPVTLRVRRIGYSQKTVDVPLGTTDVTVSLGRDVLQLETQVVTGQATTISSQRAATSVSVVTGEQLNRVPAQTIENALQGKVPGALISQNSGAPGGGMQIQIRGTNTINASFQPLYVIDGVVVNNGAIAIGTNSITFAGGGIASNQDQQVNRVADLNPADIADIQVLKGPAAGAIYGSSGSNGVVIITTKSGMTGRPEVNLIQRFGTQSLAKKFDLRCYSLAEATDPAGSFAIAPADYHGCVDFQDELYGNKFLSYETDLSVRGGSSGTTYFLSGLAKHDGGLAQNSGYNKQSLRANLTQQVGTRINLRGNAELIHSLTERGISGNDNTNINPYTIMSATPTFFEMKKDASGIFPFNSYPGNGANFLQDADLVHTPEDVYRQIGGAQANVALIASDRQTLDFRLQGGIDHYDDNARVYSPPELYYEQTNTVSPYPGTVVNTKGVVTTATLNASLAHRLIASAFTATTSAGVRQGRAQSDVINSLGNGLLPGVTNFATAQQQSSAEGQSLVKDFSYYGQEEFSTLADRLFLTAAVNAERSSNNGDTKKFYAYPKFSASYRMPFLPPATDNLKLRIAYGRAGNKPNFNNKFTFLTTLNEEQFVGLRPSTLNGLPTIKPEQTTELEGGFDAQFFNGRAALDFTQYRKQSDDLILTAALAPSTGFTAQVINGGQLVNHGTEIGLTMQPIQRGGFDWISRTTYASNKGKITRLPVPKFDVGNRFSERYGIGRIEQGFSPTQVMVFWGWDSTFANGARGSAGCPIGVPPATCGAFVSRARHELHAGDSNPDYQMGFSNDFTFGPLKLATLVDWRKGGKTANLTANYFDGNLVGGSWADTAATRQRYQVDFLQNGYGVYLENSGFVKIREITLSYTVPQSFANAFMRGGRDVRLEFSGRNLKTWTKYTGLDPEVSNFGNVAVGRIQDVTPYPPSRSYFFSIATDF